MEALNIDGSDLPTINVKQTLELLECPVCFDCMIPPIYQCREGHPLCCECIGKVKICPTCRSSSIDIRCRVLDRLAESVGKVSCRYASLGCKAVIKYELKKEHESRCHYKHFKCLHSDQGCGFEGTAEDLVNHLVCMHDYEEIEGKIINFCCNSKNLQSKKSKSSGKQLFWQRHIYHCYDKHFVLRVHRKADVDPAIYISLIVIHWKHHSNRYTLAIQGNHRKYSFEGPVWSVRKGFKEVERVRDCLILPENIALFLSGGKGSETDLNLINLSIVGTILP
ncbi:uncharacterized protein LOC128884175 isoform X2 [Hylaeus volcanicus]|nr:uncharacterized protein LOC128884175 isoform X2 [Hylaeus volcanicus]XP_053993293.1 uncharacterized protein LOC128884175 isoform X2 [Hylaeus volcanicus]